MVASGVFAGDHREIELAVFFTVKDKQLSEMRIVGDVDAFNELRRAAGLPALR